MPSDSPPKRPSKARIMVGTRLTPGMVARVDALADRRGVLRGQWIRQAIERVVQAEEAKRTGGDGK